MTELTEEQKASARKVGATLGMIARSLWMITLYIMVTISCAGTVWLITR
jgi:hypothetical protein